MGSRLVAAAFVAACGSSTPAPPQPVRPVLVSNILRDDYAGSKSCADCHGEIYAAWERSPMRNMTRDATTAAFRAPFDGATLHVGSDVVTMTMDRGARFIDVAAGSEHTRWRVTKVIGGHYREDYAGVDVTNAADPLTATGTDRILPATFVFSSATWRYKLYSVMIRERRRVVDGGVWSRDCIACHNTLPLVTMLYDDLYGSDLPTYQGKLGDRLLPRSLVWQTTPRDATGLGRVLADEIRFLGGTPPPVGADLRELLPAAARASEVGLDGGHVVELGIGCEACHNGGKAHAADPDVEPDFVATSPLLEQHPPPGQTGTRAQWITHTCEKCHNALFERYTWTWEGGNRHDVDPGGSTINSGEGRDFQLGHCAAQLACTACHDPHTVDPPEKLAAEATKAGDALCTKCHAGVPEHSHHKTVGCIACHMAKKNMGLDYGLERYHRIGSPDDPVRVERDRPVECALCHADKPVETLVAQMEAWWGKRYDRAKLRALYGDDLGVVATYATLQRGKPHEQAVAAVALADAGDRSAVADIVPLLANDYPLIRYFAQRALQRLTGDPVAIDVGAPATDVRTAAAAWLTRVGRAPK